jgi:hypothetical protein
MNSLGSYVTSFTLAKFIKDITTPITSTKAYELGIVDARGNVQRQPKTSQETSAWTPYDQMVISVRKLFDRIPDPSTKARLSSFVAAVKLFTESFESVGGDADEFQHGVFNYLLEQEVITNEDIANVMGTGNIAGLGIGPTPPDNVKIRPLNLQRKQKVFNGCDPESMSPDEFLDCFNRRNKPKTKESGSPILFTTRRKEK